MTIVMICDGTEPLQLDSKKRKDKPSENSRLGLSSFSKVLSVSKAQSLAETSDNFREVFTWL